MKKKKKLVYHQPSLGRGHLYAERWIRQRHGGRSGQEVWIWPMPSGADVGQGVAWNQKVGQTKKGVKQQPSHTHMFRNQKAVEMITFAHSNAQTNIFKQRLQHISIRSLTSRLCYVFILFYFILCVCVILSWFMFCRDNFSDILTILTNKTERTSSHTTAGEAVVSFFRSRPKASRTFLWLRVKRLFSLAPSM